MTQLWEAGLKGRAQLQPQSQLQTTSSSGLRGCSAVIHLTQRLSHLKKKNLPTQGLLRGLFPDTIQGMAGRSSPSNNKAVVAGGPSAPLCIPTWYTMGPADRCGRPGVPLPRVSPRTILFPGTVHSISNISALGIPTSLFLFLVSF